MTTGRRARGGHGSVVPDADIRSYHDQPVIKPPVWTWEIPWYFFSGGLAGASSVLACAARAQSQHRLARTSRTVALAGALASPALLVSDLGRPARFLNMLRVFRPSSPMSMGSWLLAAYGPTAGIAALLDRLGRVPRLQRSAELSAAALGPGVATYTAVLVADTAVPVWHEARRELPFLFAAGSLASAGAAAAMFLPAQDSGLARRAAVVGGLAEQVTSQAMERRLGELGRPYEEGRSGRLARTAKALTAAGTATMALTGRRRAGAVAGAGLILGGAVCQRWAVFRAGDQSARDPAATIGPQRRRADAAHRA